jgi:hypothetical protein
MDMAVFGQATLAVIPLAAGHPGGMASAMLRVWTSPVVTGDPGDLTPHRRLQPARAEASPFRTGSRATAAAQGRSTRKRGAFGPE